MRFSKALNLTSIKQADIFIARFIKPSLSLLPLLPDSGRLLDIGSGMGIPSIPILLENPGLKGVLVDRRKKRAEFLRHVGRTLSLDLEVYDQDVLDLPCLYVDACVARAVAEPDIVLNLCTPHIHSGGVAVLSVPMRQPPVNREGWAFIDETTIPAGEATQLVHRYQFF